MRSVRRPPGRSAGRGWTGKAVCKGRHVGRAADQLEFVGGSKMISDGHQVGRQPVVVHGTQGSPDALVSVAEEVLAGD